MVSEVSRKSMLQIYCDGPYLREVATALKLEIRQAMAAPGKRRPAPRCQNDQRFSRRLRRSVLTLAVPVCYVAFSLL